jgi:hypothetical protein
MSDIYIKIKTTGIKADDWEKAWQNMTKIVKAVPVTFFRYKHYTETKDGTSYFTTKLIENEGTDNENLSFKGDALSLCFGEYFMIHRNFEKLKELLPPVNVVEDKPVYWIPEKGIGDRYTIYANGNTLGKEWGIKAGQSPHLYIILAIGILYENYFPENFFIWSDTPQDEVDKVHSWLENLFEQSFNKPICHDVSSMIVKLKKHYEKTIHIMTRVDCLYRSSESVKIHHFLAHFGNESTLFYYAHKLSKTSFGTYGFYDLLDAWMNVTKNLELTLALLARSKELLNLQNEKVKEEKYDLTVILKSLLKNYILWTPQQRERLDIFFTNKKRLETGSENLFDMLFRMKGMRIDICPIYATEQELFEAFMYHSPKQGQVFKQIIDDWVAQNEAIQLEVSEKIASVEQQIQDLQEQEESEYERPDEVEKLGFLSAYLEKDRFWIEKAIEENPYCLNLDKGIEDIYEELEVFKNKVENALFIDEIRSETDTKKKDTIKINLAHQRFTVSKAFYEALKKESDTEVLFHLRLFSSLKITDDDKKYFKFYLFSDLRYWNKWRKS